MTGRTDWEEEARRLFKVSRPEHFTDYTHCCECREHDETLQGSDIDTIGMEQLGNPGWDPICFATPEARLYYLPAMVRLSLETLQEDQYLPQFLFHSCFSRFARRALPSRPTWTPRHE